ncbi:uncharacterized protein JCM15063_003386 [Sporobolomyces koalae]|uniref:uncharacterized protein n=1 Tax=Sporobolomyces koalae TaxID=500713 RepID=UPI0031706816
MESSSTASADDGPASTSTSNAFRSASPNRSTGTSENDHAPDPTADRDMAEETLASTRDQSGGPKALTDEASSIDRGGAPRKESGTEDSPGTVTEAGSDPGSKGGKGKQPEKAEDRFSCCICLDLAEDPVVTPCGHLSCWPCCHEWLVTSNKRTCPVCKAAVSVDRLVPIYSAEKPLPPRPRPVPPAAPPVSSFLGIPLLNASTLSSSSFSFQAGGIFPFSGVSMSYTYPPAEEGTRPAGFDVRRGLVPGGEQEWLRQVFQQMFLVLFFAVFVMITFTG